MVLSGIANEFPGSVASFVFSSAFVEFIYFVEFEVFPNFMPTLL